MMRGLTSQRSIKTTFSGERLQSFYINLIGTIELIQIQVSGVLNTIFFFYEENSFDRSLNITSKNKPDLMEYKRNIQIFYGFNSYMNISMSYSCVHHRSHFLVPFLI